LESKGGGIVTESSSFLKKGTKKLFRMGAGGSRPRTPMGKSFLVLFFKKELLPSLSEGFLA
jgi:hypothetical protein